MKTPSSKIAEGFDFGCRRRGKVSVHWLVQASDVGENGGERGHEPFGPEKMKAPDILAGGLKYFLFSSLPGEDSQFD